MSDTTIERIETWYLRVPLETPITLGEMVIAHRDFVLVRVGTAGGAEGVAYSLTRGAPLDLVLADVVAPRLLGRDALDPAARREELVRGLVMLGAVGLVGRALSLVDICLWDIKARLAGLPVWRLLGGGDDSSATSEASGPREASATSEASGPAAAAGMRGHAPVIMVAPYARPGEEDAAYAERLVGLVARGYSTLKLYPMPDPVAMRARLAVVRQRLGERIGLVVDMSWSFRTAAQAVEAVGMWEDLGLAWVEDPFPADEWRSIRALSEAVDTPIGVGDEVSEPSVVERLISERAVDLVRLDATSMGGFTGFAALLRQAESAGLPVSPHAYGEIQQHCVFGWGGVSPVELFAPDSPTWGTGRFMRRQLDVDPSAEPAIPHGELAAPSTPGLGLEFDWSAVRALSLRNTTT